MAFGLVHFLGQGLVGLCVVAFLAMPCMMAKKVDLDADDPS